MSDKTPLEKIIEENERHNEKIDELESKIKKEKETHNNTVEELFEETKKFKYYTQIRELQDRKQVCRSDITSFFEKVGIIIGSLIDTKRITINKDLTIRDNNVWEYGQSSKAVPRSFLDNLNDIKKVCREMIDDEEDMKKVLYLLEKIKQVKKDLRVMVENQFIQKI